jgi:hypothetical protein
MSQLRLPNIFSSTTPPPPETAATTAVTPSPTTEIVKGDHHDDDKHDADTNITNIHESPSLTSSANPPTLITDNDQIQKGENKINNHDICDDVSSPVQNIVEDYEQGIKSPLHEELDGNENDNDNELGGIHDTNDEDEAISNNQSSSSFSTPISRFIHQILWSKSATTTKKRKLNTVDDVAKQIISEYQIRKERVDRIGYVRGDIEKIKDIWEGDFGLTLFIPFDFDTFIEPSDDEGDDSNDDESYYSDDDEIMLDDEPEMESLPPILSNEQMKEISRRGLPASVRLMTWTRAYSLRRDGDYFGTMFDKCSFFKHTLIVIKTTDGDLLGGYADTPWGEHQNSTGLQGSCNFFGSGQAFIFANFPDLTEEEKEEEKLGRKSTDLMHFYRWSGENEYCQICDVDKGSMGMGGGGEFGWFVQRDFTIGSTGRCFTFRNPPLTKGNDGSFHILDVEVYGFISMSGRSSVASFGSYGKHSSHSFSPNPYGRQQSFGSSSSSVVSLLE